MRLEAILLLSTGVAAADPAAAVRIEGFAFVPERIEVASGTAVTWTNRDDVPHVVAAVDHDFATPALDTGEQASVRFDHPGAFAYFCSLHPHMQGLVVVR